MLVAARSFDSRWHWAPGREASPLVPASLKTHTNFSAAVGAAIRRATGADIAMVGSYGPPAESPIVASVTRVSDVTPLFFSVPIGVCTFSGAELMDITRKFADASDPPLMVCHSPSGDPTRMEPAHSYRVALPTGVIARFSGMAQTASRSHRHTDL